MKHILLFIGALLSVVVLMYVIVFKPATAPEPSGVLDDASVTLTEDVSENGDVPPDIALHIASKADKIVLESPLPFTVISSPVVLTGKARGTWFFEASFPVVVVDWDGRIIGEGIATATKDWMTEDFVPFTASITFTVDVNAYSNRGALILKRDNPSGLPENDDALEIPVVFADIEAAKNPGDEPLAESEAPSLSGATWHWQRLVQADGLVVQANEPARFSLRLAPDGSFSASTDCNSAGGNYTVTGSSVTFEDMMSTMMYCEGSQEQVYLAALGSIVSFKFPTVDTLELILKDGGVMTYRTPR